MNVFFPTIDFLLLESCQLYIIAKYKDNNCCKKAAVIQRYLSYKIHRKTPVPNKAAA